MGMMELGSREKDGKVYYDFMLNRGPQHPGYGPVRLIVKVNGDYIEDARLDPGYVHRGLEKLMEYRTALQNIPLAERACFIDSINSTRAYVMAVEKLVGIEVPEYVEVLRTLAGELNRIVSHLTRLGMAGGAMSQHTAFMRSIKARERALIALEALTGGRYGTEFIIPGGLTNDMPQDLPDIIEREFKKIEERLKDVETVLLKNRIFQSRLIGVGILKPEEAIELGVTGPSLRGSGVRYDVREADGYGYYKEIDFEPVVAEKGDIYEIGDCYARVRVRYQEIRRSMEMVRKLVKIAQSFPKNERKILAIPKPRVATLTFEPGEAYARTERARGEMLYYIVAKKKGPYPYRVKIKSPSPTLMQAFLKLIKGVRIADIPAIHLSLDECPGDLDR